MSDVTHRPGDAPLHPQAPTQPPLQASGPARQRPFASHLPEVRAALQQVRTLLTGLGITLSQLDPQSDDFATGLSVAAQLQASHDELARALAELEREAAAQER